MAKRNTEPSDLVQTEPAMTDEQTILSAIESGTVQAETGRSGLANVPNPKTGKAIRRILRKAGIRLSKDPSIGTLTVLVKDGSAYVTVKGKVYRTAVRPDEPDGSNES